MIDTANKLGLNRRSLRRMSTCGATRICRPSRLTVRLLGFSMLFASILLLTSCGESKQDQKIRIALNWYPDAQHGGFYAALLNGYYEQEGLNVEIVPGGPNVPVLEKVAQGRVEFGVSNADQILLKRNQQASLVALMAPLQESPRCIIVHRDSGISTFDELNGVTLALGPGRPFAEYLKRHAPMRDVRIVNYSGSVKRFVDDPQFAQQGYSFSEPIVARQLGADPVLLMLKDIGYSPYSSCLFADETFVEQNREVVQRFVRASIRGWQAYLESPDNANEHIQQLNPELDRESLQESVSAIRELCVPAGKSIAAVGTMESSRWELLLDQLKEIEFVDQEMTLEGAYELRFLDDATDKSSDAKASRAE